MKPSKENNTLEIGVDEAGYGPLIGPVYAAAVIWPRELEIPDHIRIEDSKKLKPHHLKASFEFIINNAVAYGVGSSTVDEINTIGIKPANIQAMHRAIDQCELTPDLIIVDGINFDIYFDQHGNAVDYITIEKGDATYYSITAASILAKWSRDQYMLEFCKLHPELDQRYKISQNKGYGTKDHKDGLAKYGYCQFHRKYKFINGLELNPVK